MDDTLRITPDQCMQQFFEFIRTSLDENNQLVYREQLVINIDQGLMSLCVALDALAKSSPVLHDCLRDRPLYYLEASEKAIKYAYYSSKHGMNLEEARSIGPNDSRYVDHIQLQLMDDHTVTLRDLQTIISPEKLVALKGIVVSASRAAHKACKVKLMCRNCKHKKMLEIPVNRSAAVVPRSCENASMQMDNEKCPQDPYTIVADECVYHDTQTFKLQELPEHVPTGEMPRHLSVYATRQLVDRCKPGDRLCVVGVSSTTEGHTQKDGKHSDEPMMATVRNSYLHLLGILRLSGGGGDAGVCGEVEEAIKTLAQHPNIRDRLFKSVAPALFGSDELKRALCCLLFSGCRKVMPDNTKIRGDLNVLLLGDPGTGKSQLLKFVEQVAPVSVFTSGKGSSAAGLTASIIKDGSGAFALEGGAMVLADGGVVCIDEFDKMRSDDRVAIHEAMEQQTISIAKAGITTVLNTRCAVLAAANPMFGSYDESKEVSDQLDFQSTILSRFDMIFLVKDDRNIENDMHLAAHVIDLHRQGASRNNTTGNIKTGADGTGGDLNAVERMQMLKQIARAALQTGSESVPLPPQLLRAYIRFARQECSPRLSEESAKLLENTYVDIRAEVNRERNTKNKSIIPITIRQLEAITRISESIAKMELCDTVSVSHVHEAVRLFNISTMEAARSGIHTETLSPQDLAEVKKCEEAVCRRVHVNARVSRTAVVTDLSKRGFQPQFVQRAIQAMLRSGGLEERSDFTLLRRF
eukprot:GHVR01085811.1.p1 GENE.GHVR01085811.1~~GHVR01085811.1.p1  ORF type:complete len:752 (+),score=192.83 GHVR01085811.1:86-2341(+)